MNIWEAMQGSTHFRHDDFYDGRWLNFKHSENLLLRWKFLGSDKWDSKIDSVVSPKTETKEETAKILKEEEASKLVAQTNKKAGVEITKEYVEAVNKMQDEPVGPTAVKVE